MSRDARNRIDELESQVIFAKIMARHLWAVVKARVDNAATVLFQEGLHYDAQRVIDVTFDAAEIVWERHRVRVQPCRVILDGGPAGSFVSGPSQPEMYVAEYPGGEIRNINRDQLLMMAGMDVDAGENSVA